MVRNDRELFAIRHANRTLRKDRAADLVHRTAWADRIESHRAQHIPGRGLTAIIVSRNTERPGTVPEVQQHAHTPLSLPRLPGEVVEIGDMEAGFVALRIQSYQSGRVGELIEVAVLRCPILLHEE